MGDMVAMADRYYDDPKHAATRLQPANDQSLSISRQVSDDLIHRLATGRT